LPAIYNLHQKWKFDGHKHEEILSHIIKDCYKQNLWHSFYYFVKSHVAPTGRQWIEVMYWDIVRQPQ